MEPASPPLKVGLQRTSSLQVHAMPSSMCKQPVPWLRGWPPRFWTISWSFHGPGQNVQAGRVDSLNWKWNTAVLFVETMIVGWRVIRQPSEMEAGRVSTLLTSLGPFHHSDLFRAARSTRRAKICSSQSAMPSTPRSVGVRRWRPGMGKANLK